MNTVVTPVPSSSSRRFGVPLLVGGAIVLAIGGASAGWLMRANADDTPAPVAVAANAFEPLESPQAKAPADGEPPVAPVPRKAVDKPAPVARTATPKPAPRPAAEPSYAGERSTPLPTQRAAVCADCGIVESVVPVQRKGEGSGVGAVAGGVVGAVVGNQVGGGNGRKAMTVLGAIGGGLAGHEIEKRAKAETVYEVKVRMEDGSVRTVTQKTEPAVGARVTVEGDTLRPAAAGNAPRTIRTSV